MSSLAGERSDNSSQISDFREIADRICAITSRYSLSFIGYHSPELPLYSAISFENREEVLKNLRLFLATLESVEASGDRLDNQERSAWHAMRSMGLVPPSDLFSKFASDDVIEILDLSGVQLWRNFNFLKICSYSLEEMYCLDWRARYTREEGKIAECAEKIGALLTCRTPDIFYANVEDHVITETSSSERLILQVRHDYIARLKSQSGQLTAWVVTSRVKILGKSAFVPDSHHRLRLLENVASL